MTRHFLLTILFCLIGNVALSAPAQALDPFKTTGATPEETFLPVKDAYRPSVEFAGDQLRLHWEIADGYYLYRQRFAFKTTAGADIAAQIPPGKSKDDDYLGHIEVYYHALDITLTPPPSAQAFSLAVTAQGCADAGLCYPPTLWYWRIDPMAKTATVSAAPGIAPDAVASASTTLKTKPKSPAVWLTMLLFAIAGGSILNLMPCVFPVLSLKVLGFASHKEEHLAAHGLAYTLGVVLSFILVAVVLLVLKAAGQAVGWGFQLQQPWFVAALAYVFFAMGLSLSGFWELGGRWMGLGNTLTARAGYIGSFFTGMLATLVASPCTAPLMAPALGFATTRPAMQALSIFAALGFGMALPVLLLCLNPRLLARIPRPGIWMDRFKQALAFPLYATAIWLCWVGGQQTGVSGMMAILVGALMIVLGLWLWRFGRFARAAALLVFAIALAILGSPLLKAATAIGAAEQQADRNREPYSPEKLAALRREGAAVFIDATADWCITCLANEKVTLDTRAVKDAFALHHVTYLKADWTHYDASITALLARFGRNGVPLYVFFPAGANTQPIVLPQLLRPSIVIEALDATARHRS